MPDPNSELAQPPAPDISEETARTIAQLSFRAARARFRISYKTWADIKSGRVKCWQPYVGGGVTQADVQEILDTVRQNPSWNTVARARRLGKRAETIQRILASRGLSRLNARLQYAGYSVDMPGPLVRARQHRVLASGPGCYTCGDFKRLGAFLRAERGHTKATSVSFSGCQFIDHYSGWASCYVTETQDSATAAAALQRYCETAPFRVEGLLLTDNALAFLSDDFIGWCATHKILNRTTRFAHPWSNGKVEAFNRTLKYSVMPGIVAAGVSAIPEIQAWIDRWLLWYNTKRAHGGWINRGLPPQVVIESWNRQPGDVFQKLVALGHVKPEEVNRTRLLGSGKHAVDLALESKSPYAFVIEAPPPRSYRATVDGWCLPG